MISRFTIRSYFNISISHSMVRPRTIDREYLLNVAEDIAAATGASNIVSSVKPSSGPSLATLRSSPYRPKVTARLSSAGILPSNSQSARLNPGCPASSALESGSNRAQWCDPVFDRILNQALLTDDQLQRRSFYLAAQQYLQTEMPLVALAHSQRIQAINSQIEGVTINPYGGISFANAGKAL